MTQLRVILSFFSWLFFLTLAAQETPVRIAVETKKVSACEFDVIFRAKIDAGWHVYSLKKSGEDGPNPTVFTFKKSKDYMTVGKPTEGKAEKEYDKQFLMEVLYFKKEAVFTQRIKIKGSGKIIVKGKYEYQACTDEKCIFPPADEFEVTIDGEDGCLEQTKIGIISDADSVQKETGVAVKSDSSIKVSTDTAKKAVIESSVASKPDGDSCHPWDKFLLGLLAGLGAVFMPCIYSLVPLTVSFFIKKEVSRARGIRNAMLYGFFIVISFVIPTMLITVIFGPDTLSKIATNTWLNLFFFALFVVFALSFFGMFEITLPSSWGNKLDRQADKGGVLGIFFMAATLVIVSFSCTAGFLGPLLTALAEGSSYLCPLFGFTGFGSGIALPFMLFAFFPSMLKALPKSGGWMTTFKVSIAFIELALAVKFLSNADNVNEWGFITREVFIALWIGIFGMMTIYLLGIFRTSHDDPPGHLSTGRILFASITLSFTVYMIPGMWGAPLQLISSFPPPHHYAESPDGIGGKAQIINNATAGPTIPGTFSLEQQKVSGPGGLRIFINSYDSALLYSKLVRKPLFIDFTGNACVNCRLMESNIWIKPEVLALLRDSVVIVSLYVDNKVELPEKDQKEVFWYGKNRTLETVGDKWAYLQTVTYKSSSQPMYVVVDEKQKMLSDGTKGTELDAKIFSNWLQAAISAGRK